MRLTMGGEPTFVSVDDMDAPEWNTAADGPTKRRLAIDLTQRLVPDFAPGALIAHGQGKWYPGEPLPRWQIGVHWRTDGTPLWHDPALLADPLEPGDATTADAQALAAAICAAVGLPADAPVPAYEDPVGRLLERGPAARRRPARARRPRPADDDGRSATRDARAALIDGARRRARRRRSAGRSRCTAPPATRPGRPAAGRCAAAICSSSPATHRWACACRSTR